MKENDNNEMDDIFWNSNKYKINIVLFYIFKINFIFKQNKY